jgi:DNA primase large subunit
MVYEPSGKELAHFPFLKKANERIRSLPPIELLLREEKGAFITRLASGRISHALSPEKRGNPAPDNKPEDEIAGYVLSRIIASCIGDRQVLDRLARYEADRAYRFLVTETGSADGEGGWNENVAFEGEFSPLARYLAGEFGIDITKNEMPLADYVEISAPLHEPRFKLVNRNVTDGFVMIQPEERYELLRERIRVVLRRDLPYRNIPKSLCEQVLPASEQLKKRYQEQMLENFGDIEEGAFPPCIQALIAAITSGANLTHPGRFSLTSFLHTIGMNNDQIAGLFARAPDFDPEKTMYQVGHITGGGGTEYTAPACAAMRTTGLCVRPDKTCDMINHPLSYYRAAKKRHMKRSTPPADRRPDS